MNNNDENNNEVIVGNVLEHNTSFMSQHSLETYVSAELADILRYCAKTDDLNSFSLLTSMLPCVSTLMGRNTKLMLNRKEFKPIVWTLDVKPSGGRKSRLQNAILKPMWKLVNEHWFKINTDDDDHEDAGDDEPDATGSSRYCSDSIIVTEATVEGILQTIAATNGLALLAPSEFVGFLQKIGNTHGGASTKNSLLDLHDGTPVHRSLASGYTKIPSHITNVMSATQPLNLVPHFRTRDTTGIFSRFLLCVGDFENCINGTDDEESDDVSGNASYDVFIDETTDDDEMEVEEAEEETNCSVQTFIDCIIDVVTRLRGAGNVFQFKGTKKAAQIAKKYENEILREAESERDRPDLQDLLYKRTTMHCRIAPILFIMQKAAEIFKGCHEISLNAIIEAKHMKHACRLMNLYNQIHLDLITQIRKDAVVKTEYHKRIVNGLLYRMIREDPGTRVWSIAQLARNIGRKPLTFKQKRHMYLLAAIDIATPYRLVEVFIRVGDEETELTAEQRQTICSYQMCDPNVNQVELPQGVYTRTLPREELLQRTKHIALFGFEEGDILRMLQQ